MAHELSFTTDAATGAKRADMFSVRETPWHAEGVRLEGAPTLDEALALAHMDYTVEKRAVTFAGKDGARIESAIAYVNVRVDRDAELGHVGPQYTVVQNRDAFAATVGPLLDSGVLTLETGGVLRNGADAWLLGKFALDKFGPNARDVFGSEVVPYALVKVNHSGRRNNEIALTPIRVVCANTLGMVEGEVDGGHGGAAEGDVVESASGSTKSIGVIHRASAQQKMTAAAEKLFGNLVQRCEVVAAQYRLLKDTLLDASQFRALVLVPSIGVHPTRRRGWNPEARQADTVVERYESKAAAITTLWEKGDGHTGDRSAWEAYNGLVQAVDHDGELFPTRAGVYRTGQLMSGYLREMKDSGLATLVTYAKDTQAAVAADKRDILADILAETNRRAALALAK